MAVALRLRVLVARCVREAAYLTAAIALGVPLAFALAFVESELMGDYLAFDEPAAAGYVGLVCAGVWILLMARRLGARPGDASLRLREVAYLTTREAAWGVVALGIGCALAATLAFVDTDLLNDNFDFDDLETASVAVVLTVLVWSLLFARRLGANARRLAVDLGLSSVDEGLKFGDGAREQIIRSLRTRARRLQAAARATLAIIVTTLVAGTAIFLNAGNVATRESDPRLTQLSFLEMRISEREALIASETPDADAPTIRRRQDLDPELVRLRLERDGLVDQISGDASQMDTTVYLISSVSTRVGSVLMLLFLVQILTTLYRYSTRLAAFLHARADALQLSMADSVPLAELVPLLSPEMVDYGRMPATPTQQALGVARDVLSLTGRTGR